MFFTQDDYKKIQEWLQRNSVKDTEFQEAADLIGNEVVTLVQNGSNKKVYLKDLVNQIFSIGVTDFINVSSLYEKYNIILSEAIKLVPYKSRKRGQVITFLNAEGNWEIYQFTGVKNQWNNIELWKDLFDWQAILNLEIEADEEDITANLKENSNKVKLSFKDRQYEPSNHSGLGYKILRKNIIKYIDKVYGELTKNILMQNNISSSNTIYEIRYDFDLNNQTIYIPEKSILRYNGGSLNNGKIVYNNTRIEGKEKIKNISFEGEYSYLGLKIRFNSTNEIEVSYDEGENWNIISDSFNTNINIEDYVDEVSLLPNNVALGTVYGVKDESYTSENPKYRIYVYTSNGWIDNGLFAGISAGVVQEVGNSDTKVLSQKAVSENFINKEDIINDLSSGGTDKVLSAEMGKELSSKVLNNEFVGEGKNFSKTKIVGLIPNHTYRLCLPNLWNLEGVDGVTDAMYIFLVESFYNGKSTKLAETYVTGELKEEYIFTIPTETEFVEVGGRAAIGSTIKFFIEDISYSNDLSRELKEIIQNRIYEESDERERGDMNTVLAIYNGRMGNIQPNYSFNSEGNEVKKDGWNITKDYIEVNSGSNIVWVIGDVKAPGACLIFYNEEKVLIDYYGANTFPSRTLVVPSDCKYVRASYYQYYNGEKNVSPLIIDGVKYYVTESVKSVFVEVDKKVDEKVDKGIDIAIDTIINGRDGNILLNSSFSYTGILQKLENWYATNDYIEVEGGDTILWRIGDAKSALANLIIYDENKEYLDYWGANTTPDRSITIPAAGKYIRVSAYITYNGIENLNPIAINGVDYAVKKPIEPIRPSDNEHGIIGKYYPEETADIEKMLSYDEYGFANRFHFLHVSDNHGGSFGHADEFVDLCPALFLINTGDMLNDRFSDFQSSQTVELATSTEKPCYLVLGNHDYSHATSKQDVFDAFMKPTHQHNGVNTDKSYYSVDYVEQGVKCIMLDMNDGWSDDELQQLGPTPLTRGKMSSGQINWLISQLEDAATNNLHVCLFIHIAPCQIDADRVIDNFSDYHSIGSVIASNLTFLADIVDAWIDAKNVTFDYNGTSYNHTFSSGGHFVSWFFGHLHWDECGWMDGHPNQFMVGVCKPVGGYTGFGSYDGDKLGVHFNYYTVDTFINSLAVYRVGQQDTVYATKRKSFRIRYK